MKPYKNHRSIGNAPLNTNEVLPAESLNLNYSGTRSLVHRFR